EIWAGSSFIANTLSPISPIPVVRIPPVLTPEAAGSREAGRRRLEVSPEEFVYLFIFDFHSCFQRKNPLAVLDAFRTAFAPSDPVRLVIKCVNPDFNREHFAALQARARDYPVSIYSGYWSAEEMRDLMAACDAYVSLHRSEGVGLTITDAMALGKPVIATGWSGNTDFMNVANSHPVRYELVRIREGVGPYREGETWAEPSVDHAAGLMRQVFEDREAAASLGGAARRDIEAQYSPAAAGRLIRRRLEAVALRRRLPDFRREVKARYAHYRRLPDRIREVVSRTVPAGAVVAVVSKGDADLVRLEGRAGWHFPRSPGGAHAGH